MKTEFFWDEVGAGIPAISAHILLWRLHLTVNKKQRGKNSIGITGMSESWEKVRLEQESWDAPSLEVSKNEAWMVEGCLPVGLEMLFKVPPYSNQAGIP